MKIYFDRVPNADVPWIKKDDPGRPFLFLHGINIDVRSPVDIMAEPVWLPLVTWEFIPGVKIISFAKATASVVPN